MVDILDYKKEYNDLYIPKEKPTVVDVPVMKFIMIDGVGNPNEEKGEYQAAAEVLYGLSYAIKMSKMKVAPVGYFEYVVPPLEGLWWFDEQVSGISQTNNFCWISMIRQPEFVTEEVFEAAIREVNRKKPQVDTGRARLDTFSEGLCVQMMHVGPFADEPKTIAIIEKYIIENGFANAISDILPDGKIRRHHEIYMADPRKIAPEKMKTVLRIPVRRLVPRT